jgi:hypothetical protein
MNWFKPKHSVCSECKVHFEPATGEDLLWPNLCESHRKPKRDLHMRKLRVQSWAACNWEKLEAQVLEEEKARVAAFNANLQSTFQSAGCGSQGGYGSLHGGFGQIFGFSQR